MTKVYCKEKNIVRFGRFLTLAAWLFGGAIGVELIIKLGMFSTLWVAVFTYGVGLLGIIRKIVEMDEND